MQVQYYSMQLVIALRQQGAKNIAKGPILTRKGATGCYDQLEAKLPRWIGSRSMMPLKVGRGASRAARSRRSLRS
ncbi:Pre-mRNA-processing ATP-dependent RNA helicase PRP5 [Fusarium oxysporum f. sp. albedinis]|nr:Pre-mRNA-processing ATP-dependent RNA helicase PRP5 [Fusarium oxysporum f. sp. albedinis]